jgi:putative DNA-invertase from lambdoid prophage Rac
MRNASSVSKLPNRSGSAKMMKGHCWSHSGTVLRRPRLKEKLRCLLTQTPCCTQTVYHIGMKAALYARVSTNDQDCSMQLRELREYCARQHWDVFHEYVDKGISGAKANRPALKRLMADARQRHFDGVLVWKLDRFGRSLQQLIENVQALDSYSVRFVSTTQGIDTDQRNPCGRLLLNILGSLAEFERDTILERVRSGIANAKANGVHCGRPRKVFRRDEAKRLYAGGMSIRSIAKKLGVSVMTIQRCTKTPDENRAVAH